MIGRRSSQRDLFDVGNVFPLELDPKSFYGQLAGAAPRLFSDDAFAPVYSDGTGRPSVPPSLLALMTLLQHYEGCSDEEASQSSAYDLRWCAVLGKAGGEPLCAKSTLQLFRAHLVVHDKVRALFQESIAEAKRTGLLKRGTALRAALDTKPVVGRGAVEDTYNLLATGVRQLARALAVQAKQGAEEWAEGHGLERYFGSSIKGQADIDWSDASAREAVLSGIVADARRVLGLAEDALRAGEDAKTRAAAKLLEEVLLQDIEEGSQGEGEAQAKIKEGTAPNRVCSATEPEQRHGRKSSSKKFNGYKAAVAVDVESQIIVDVDVLAANAGDAQGALDQVKRAEENTGEQVEETLGDCAYGGGDTRQAFADAERELHAKVPAGSPNKGKFAKSDFQVDPENNTVSCPGGVTTDQFQQQKDGSKVFVFGAVCAACALREQCTTSAQGRSVAMHPQEKLLQEARAFQESREGRAKLRDRVGVEHALARLGHLGIGQARYLGRTKTRFQLMMAATVANFRRTWNWVRNPGARPGEVSGSQQAQGAGQHPIGPMESLLWRLWRWRRPRLHHPLPPLYRARWPRLAPQATLA